MTALRADDRRHVAVELDGSHWRTLPVDVVVRAGLALGLELDRPRARTVGRELRRAAALAVAARAVTAREVTRRSLDDRLARRRVAPADRAAAVETLVRVGAVDDARFAHGRAAALAARHRGDAAIRWDLERQGIAAVLAEEAVAALEPERARAERVVAKRGRSVATARLLAGRGFAEEIVEDVVGDVAEAGPER